MTNEPYTVIILYPERVAPGTCYIAHVTAFNILQAIKEGQLQAMKKQENHERGVRADWRAIAVLNGHASLAWVSA